MMDINLKKSKRIVRMVGVADIFYGDTVPSYDFRAVDTTYDPSLVDGFVFTTTLPSGIDIFNQQLGATGFIDMATSGYSRIGALDLESNLRRSGVSVSGSRTLTGR